MKVCIAEKPSVAREIAAILGANTKRDGFYEGNGYAVTYTFGHLCTLLEPKDYKPHWKSWDLNNLPMLPERFDTKVTGDAGIRKQFNWLLNRPSQNRPPHSSSRLALRATVSFMQRIYQLMSVSR